MEIPRKMDVRMRYLGRKVKEGLADHIASCTGFIVESNPIYAVNECFIAGVSDEVSLNTRIAASISALAGVGFIYERGRRASRKLFGVTQKSKEIAQNFHDAAYSTVFNAGFAPTLYLIAGERDVKKIAVATGTSMLIGLANGGPMGYAADAFRDLFGVENSPRVPELVRRQNPSVKKMVGLGAIAASAGIIAGIYAITPDEKRESPTENVAGVHVEESPSQREFVCEDWRYAHG